MTGRIVTTLAVVGLLGLAGAGDALGQRANPCGARNPCAGKKAAAGEAAAVKSGDGGTTRAARFDERRRAPLTDPGARPPGPPSPDSVQSP